LRCLTILAPVDPTFIFLHQKENCHKEQKQSKTFSKLFPTTSPSFRHELILRHIQRLAGFKHRTVQPVAYSIHPQL